jgi:hypothetical protein
MVQGSLRALIARLGWAASMREDLRWEQAFSEDGGANWETNWIMEFTRAEEQA